MKQKNNKDFSNKEESKCKENSRKESEAWPCKIKRKKINTSTKELKSKSNSKMHDKKIKKHCPN